ncbi:MAG: formyl-CoA transferase [SAR202 cluster bacterium Io17-Chloro-G4]|nr:MAG: formyl-CoA transferase [SAR202 cluster bacterium Io17-Chloro-G4]
MAAALENIKVVDLTRTLAGPFCTMMLGDMGADVVKIEEPEHGDETRGWTPFWNEVSTQFLTFNRNKRSLSINLKEKEGVDIVLGLVADADIMVESFRGGTLERLGLGYEAVKKLNPNIIYTTISGYGRTGPMADMPGYDLIIQAYSGLMHLTGEPDGLPLRVGFSLVDLFTGMMTYGSILTALRHRDNTGEGQRIDSSLLDGQVATMSYHATGYMATGNEPHRMGSGHPSLVPYQSFQATDGFFILGCANQGLWEKMCQAIGRADFLDDPRYTTNTDRVAHRAECVNDLSEIFAKESTEHWVKLITSAGIPCGPINRVSDVVNNPQVQARNMVVEVPHPEVPNLRIPNSPMKLSDTPATIRRHPPMLGEHNDEILADAGFDASQITQLRDKGVIGAKAAVATPGHAD